MRGFQRAETKIHPTTPHDFPWNRLDNVVCGWNCELDPAIRLRCKRFALINYDDHDEDSATLLHKLLSGGRRGL